MVWNPDFVRAVPRPAYRKHAVDKSAQDASTATQKE